MIDMDGVLYRGDEPMPHLCESFAFLREWPILFRGTRLVNAKPMLLGIAIDKGYIDTVKHPALDFFSDRSFENRDARKQAMTVEDLLAMRSGLDWTESDPMRRDYDFVGKHHAPDH